MSGNEVYLQHILEAIDRISQFTANLGRDEFVKNQLVQSAVMRELGIIGEASKKLSEEFKENHGHIPWKKIAGMRDKLVHDYFEIDSEAVWQTVQEDVPALRIALQKLDKNN